MEPLFSSVVAETMTEKMVAPLHEAASEMSPLPTPRQEKELSPPSSSQYCSWAVLNTLSKVASKEDAV
jgi:hypothetical protein